MYSFQTLKHSFIISLLPIGSLIAQTPIDSEAETISFQEALQRTVANDPGLRRFQYAVEAADGQVEQASLRPNPVVGAEMENLFGTGPFQDIQGVDVTLGLTQLIETAGKRAKRTELARTEKAILTWEREQRLADLESGVRSAFVEVFLAQQTLELKQDQLALAERSQKAITRLAEAARANDVELTRAQLAVDRQRVAVRQAERALEATRAQLASLWGKPETTDYRVAGSVALEAKLPDFTQLLTLLPNSVHLGQYAAQQRMREAALTLEQARATPDFEVFGGGRYFNEASGDAAFVVGMEIPWPMFDKNQGNIHSARARLRAVEAESATTHRELTIALTDAYQQLEAAFQEARDVKTELIPSAEATLAEAEKGYERGQFTLLFVLESRATLFEIRETYLDALRRYATAQAGIEALTRPASINTNT